MSEFIDVSSGDENEEEEERKIENLRNRLLRDFNHLFLDPKLDKSVGEISAESELTSS